MVEHVRRKGRRGAVAALAHAALERLARVVSFDVDLQVIAGNETKTIVSRP